MESQPGLKRRVDAKGAENVKSVIAKKKKKKTSLRFSCGYDGEGLYSWFKTGHVIGRYRSKEMAILVRSRFKILCHRLKRSLLNS